LTESAEPADGSRHSLVDRGIHVGEDAVLGVDLGHVGPLGSGAWAGPPGPWLSIVHDASKTVN
jgi:hypothetical protein